MQETEPKIPKERRWSLFYFDTYLRAIRGEPDFLEIEADYE